MPLAMATPLPPLPRALAARGISLRAERVRDAAFLNTLYLSVRWEELARTGWSDAQKQAFLTSQLALQSRHYAQTYPGAARGIVLRDNVAAGRLYLFASADDLRIVDISLLPVHRGQGIGAGLIRAVMAMAAKDGRGVSLQVGTFNPDAHRLYDRLGFVETGGGGVHRHMTWAPVIHHNNSVEIDPVQSR